MKKVILMAVALFGLNTVMPAQQSAVAAANRTALTAKKENKAAGKSTVAKIEKTEKMAVKPESGGHGKEMKMDGTSDKRSKKTNITEKKVHPKRKRRKANNRNNISSKGAR